ncbi:MAG: hypothetical protein WDM86_19785 [Rhizomicrobium sp.]
MRKLLLAMCGAAILSGAPAIAADSPACVRRNDIRDWSNAGHKTLLLESYGHRKVRLTLTGNCAGFGPYDSFQIAGALESAASCIVEGDIVRTRWAGEPGVCTVVSVTPYSGELHPKGEHHLAF